MDLSASSLLAGLFASLLGFVLFRYGRKQARAPQLVTGMALMLFPYFVGGAWAIVGIATALVGALWIALRYGM